MEELTSLWKEHEAGLQDSREIDRKMLQGILRARSRSALARIRRNVWIELFTIVLPIWLLWSYVIWKGESQHLLLTGILIPALVAVAFYGVKLFVLSRNPIQHHSLRKSLQQSVWIMGTYMKIYMIMGTVVIPLLAGGGVAMGFLTQSWDQGADLISVKPWVWVLLVGVILLYGFLCYLFFRWYIGKLYGQHYQELKACLKELEED